jgi:hypothetical protein
MENARRGKHPREPLREGTAGTIQGTRPLHPEGTMMDTNEKLDYAIQLLKEILDKQDEQDTFIEEQFEEIREAISNLGLPGSGYGTFSLDDE